MKLEILIRWTNALDGEPAATSRLLEVAELARSFGVAGLYAILPGGPVEIAPTELFRKQSWRPFSGYRLDEARGPGADIELWHEPLTKQEFMTELKEEPMYFSVLYPEARAREPIAYPTVFHGRLPLTDKPEIVRRIERFLRVMAPATITVSGLKQRLSLLYLDAEHVGLAKSLELGLAPATNGLAGGWFEAHSDAVDSTTPAALAANRALTLVYQRILRSRRQAEKGNWVKPGTSPEAPTGGLLLGPSALASRVASPDPDQTVLGGRASPPPPFERRAPAAPRPIPIEAAADAGATVMVPLPVQLRVVGAPNVAGASFDPDVTQPPVPNPLPVIPFSGTTSPERMREIAGPPVREPSDDAGETVALPSSEDMKSIVEAARADLPLQEYAALRAALSVHGDDNAEVLAQFSLTALQKQAIQLKYFNRFRDEPALREQFEALLRDAMRKINRGPGGAR